jgi:hypothetical protein
MVIMLGQFLTFLLLRAFVWIGRKMIRLKTPNWIERGKYTIQIRNFKSIMLGQVTYEDYLWHSARQNCMNAIKPIMDDAGIQKAEIWERGIWIPCVCGRFYQ